MTLLTTEQAAVYLGGIKKNTLEGWRLKGIGPTYKKIGRLVRYALDDIESYLASQKRQSTSQVTFSQPVIKDAKSYKAEDSSEGLSKLQLFKMINFAPITSGIYFLWYQGEIVYVGKSSNILMRLGDHAQSKQFDSFCFIPTEKSELDKVEHFYIKKFSPFLNRMFNLDDTLPPNLK